MCLPGFYSSHQLLWQVQYHQCMPQGHFPLMQAPSAPVALHPIFPSTPLFLLRAAPLYLTFCSVKQM